MTGQAAACTLMPKRRPSGYGVPKAALARRCDRWLVAAPGPRKSEMFAQGTALIFGPEQAASSQFGQHQLDEIIETAGQERRHQVEPIAAVHAKPLLHLVGDLFG